MEDNDFMGDSDRHILKELRGLLDRYSEPCATVCEHSQCPVLRELREVVVRYSLEAAQRTVKPIIDQEQEGESVGDLMEMRLRSDGLVDIDFDPFRRVASAN